MLKFEIAMDEEKILRENKYDLNKIYSIIDDSFANFNLKKIDDGVYVDRGNENDFAHMWVIVWGLFKTEWFSNNVAKVIWHNKDSVEDVLKTIREENLKVAI